MRDTLLSRLATLNEDELRRELAELENMARDTFRSPEDASAWLRRPHPMLEGDSPVEAAKTSHGAERVKGILAAIKYGGVA